MRLKLWCDSGANIHSCREDEFDLKEFLGCDTDEEALEEWNTLTEEQQYKEVEMWAWEKLDIGFNLRRMYESRE